MFLNYKGACYLCIKKPPSQAKDLINMVCVNLEGLWMVSDRNDDFWFFIKFHKSGPAIIFRFWSTTEHVSYASKKALKEEKHLINIVCVTLEGLWMIADKIVDFRFLVKFHRSGLSIILRFWIIREHVIYATKNLLIKQTTSSTWCV